LSKSIVTTPRQQPIVTSGTLGTRILNFVRGGVWSVVNQGAPVPLQATAYVRIVQDQQPRLSLQDLTADMIISAQGTLTLGNPSPMARISDALLQSDPEIKAAVKQLKTAVGGIEFNVVPPNDSKKASMIAEDLRIAVSNPQLNMRGFKGWCIEGRIRGIGLIEQIWNDPTEKKRTWEGFSVVPQQRIRYNRVTGEAQFAETPFVFQGTDVSLYDLGKWVVIQPDMHIQDFALRGTIPALLNDWFGRLNVMGWWNQSLERDAMKTLVGKAGSDADATALKAAFTNRGAAGSFLIRDPNSSVAALDATLSRSGISPYGEYMTHTAQRMFLALLGESQTAIIEQNAGSKQSAGTQQDIARYVIEDVCTDIGFIVTRDLFAPYVEMNYGEENLVNVPTWEPKLDEPVDIVALNQAISTRPANVKLGMSFYRKATQWPEPLPKEETLAEPMPLPGQAAAGESAKLKPETPAESEKPGPGEPKNDSEAA
jgi:hypothetical protein